MITIEQIHLLETKVHKAVEHINLLSQENKALTSKLVHYQDRIDELEKLIESFRKDQGEIEKGIITALEELNRLEDGLDPEEPAPIKGSSEPDEPPVPENPAVPHTEEDSDLDAPDSPQFTDQSNTDEKEDTQSGELDIF
jgi:FtsZ-binding cell division protein ZapB